MATGGEFRPHSGFLPTDEIGAVPPRVGNVQKVRVSGRGVLTR
jgi:hypothetical protein